MKNVFLKAAALAAVTVFIALPRLHAAPSSASDILHETGVQGGLIVHLGCGDGSFTADFLAGSAFRVHGLEGDAAKVDEARAYLETRGVYGKVAVERFRGDVLPYADNLVNLIVVEDAGKVSRDEMLRVLVPEGVAWIRKGEGDDWDKIVKPRPEAMDEWTHYLHAPDNNAVARDGLVGPPDSIQWMAEPKFSRAHEQQASFSACVSAGGRIFYILDDAPRVDVRLPAQWMLMARDAFNGVTLWRRPMGAWVDQYRRFRAGPASLPFRLVAADGKVFVTLDFTGPVQVLDAATGETIRTIAGSEKTKQILYEKGILTLLIDEDVDRHEEIDAARRRGEFEPHRCRIMKVHVDSGEAVWKREIGELVFPCMALKNGRVYAQTPSKVFSLDYESGSERWSADFEAELPVSEGKLKSGEMQWEAPTLVVNDTVVLAADFKKVRAYGAGDGQVKWSGSSTSGYNAPPDMLLVGDLLWMRDKGGRAGIDPSTGEIQKEYPTQKGYMHPRCYRGTATEAFMMFGEMGVQMLDVASGDVRENDWIRGTCQYGTMPANGLLYVPPDSCACNMKTKLSGLYAFSSTRGPAYKGAGKSDAAANPLERGPAFGTIQKEEADGENGEDWPTFRGSPGRNGMTSSAVSAPLIPKWRITLGGPLSGLVVAGGRAYVAAVDRHTVYALDAVSGEKLWHYTAGGRIDSPPTVHEGSVYFGSADGWVYALRAEDGALAWRLRAAPREHRIVIREQLESSWPVHGSVLIHEGKLLCAAGRSSYLDGGIRLYTLDPKTGAILSSSTIYNPDSETGKQPVPSPEDRRDVRGVLSDILLADGSDIYMRQAKLDFATGDESGSGLHLFSPLGLLDDTWWHRAYWVVNDQFTSHWSGWWKVGNQVASGRILSYDEDEIFGFGRDTYYGGNTGQWRGGEKYQLFAHDRTAARPVEVVDRKGKKTKKEAVKEISYRWTTDVPLLATSMVVTKETVFVAGPPDAFSATGEGDELLKLEDAAGALAAWMGEKGGILYGASTADGEKVTSLEISSPTVFDGMAAAQGRLYLALQDGSVVCMAGGQ